MKIRTIALLTALCSAAWMSGSVQAQGFVFGSGEAKPEAAPVAAGARNAKVETAQRLLKRMGLLRETPSGTLTPATLEAIRAFSVQNGLAPANQVTDSLLNSIRRVIWQTR